MCTAHPAETRITSALLRAADGTRIGAAVLEVGGSNVYVLYVAASWDSPIGTAHTRPPVIDQWQLCALESTVRL